MEAMEAKNVRMFFCIDFRRLQIFTAAGGGS